MNSSNKSSRNHHINNSTTNDNLIENTITTDNINEVVKQYLLLKGCYKAAIEFEKEIHRDNNNNNNNNNNNTAMMTDDGAIPTNSKLVRQTSTGSQASYSTTNTTTTVPANSSIASNTIVMGHTQKLLSSITEDIYIIGINRSNYKLYYESYDTVLSWAMNSIDLVKTQLLSLCFPLFVHW